MKRATTEAELQTWIAAGKTYAEIAQILGVKQYVVSATLKTLGLGVGRGGATLAKPFNADAAMKMISQGLRVNDVAKAQGLHFVTAYKKMKDLQIPTTCTEYWKRKTAELENK